MIRAFYCLLCNIVQCANVSPARTHEREQSEREQPKREQSASWTPPLITFLRLSLSPSLSLCHSLLPLLSLSHSLSPGVVISPFFRRLSPLCLSPPLPGSSSLSPTILPNFGSVVPSPTLPPLTPLEPPLQRELTVPTKNSLTIRSSLSRARASRSILSRMSSLSLFSPSPNPAYFSLLLNRQAQPRACPALCRPSAQTA